MKKTPEEKVKTKWTHINLRIPVHLLKKIDKKLSKRVGIKRTGWILETINDKLVSRPVDKETYESTEDHKL